MALQDFIEAIPEDKREAFRMELLNSVQVSNREDAAKLLAEHPILKSERDAIISRTTENYDKRFNEEKKEKLVEEELKRRNPPKDDKDLRLERLEQQLKDQTKAAILKDQRARAMQALQADGLPLELAEYVVRETDDATNEELRKLTGPIKALLDNEIKKIKLEYLGNNGRPKAGEITSFDSLQQKYTDAMGSGNIAAAMMLKEQMSKTIK